MSTDFEKKFGAVLESLDETSDEELAGQVENYRSELEGREEELLASGTLVVDGASNEQASGIAQMDLDREVAKKVGQVGVGLLQASYQLSKVTAHAAAKVAVIVSEVLSDSDTDGEEQVYEQKQNAQVSSEGSVSRQEELDSKLDMVA